MPGLGFKKLPLETCSLSKWSSVFMSANLTADILLKIGDAMGHTQSRSKRHFFLDFLQVACYGRNLATLFFWYLRS